MKASDPLPTALIDSMPIGDLRAVAVARGYDDERFGTAVTRTRFKAEQAKDESFANVDWAELDKGYEADVEAAKFPKAATGVSVSYGGQQRPSGLHTTAPQGTTPQEALAAGDDHKPVEEYKTEATAEGASSDEDAA